MRKTLAIVVGLFLVGIGFGYISATREVEQAPAAETTQNTPTPVQIEDITPDVNDYDRTWNHVKDHYVKGDAKESEMFYGAVRGIVESLHDPYSEFMSPAEAKEFETSTTGAFSGIGTEIGEKDGIITIMGVIEDLPAAKAGVLSGDILVAIDGVKTQGMTLIDAVKRIRGAKGTSVKLNIYREGFKEPQDFIVVRDNLVVPAAKWKTVAVGHKQFMVLRITQFNESADKLTKKAVNQALKEHLDGLVLDLRNNPGGRLDIAGHIACRWATLPSYTIMERRGVKPEPLLCDERPTLLKMPTVVLVNKHSASASEITAGALQDYGKARIIGETTYGKGCGQNVYDYPDGSVLKLTTFYWKTPKGRAIDKVGITPDEVVKPGPDDKPNGADAQLDRAIQYLKNGR